ncbi:integration host factor subunit beta [Halomonas salinarum]|uniref:integration host factor subunit beta n=1 Tax=Halomonas salinarum TaxID=1158993 RepID=UPI002472FFBC|nr:integration host factor subunit beta [Halomonas salinarum]
MPRCCQPAGTTVRSKSMTKSELIEQIAMRQPELSVKDVEAAVRIILDDVTDALSDGGRVEIRGFGSFSLHYREPRTGRNPKTGDPVELEGKFVPHFKPGKELREQVNASRALGY